MEGERIWNDLREGKNMVKLYVNLKTVLNNKKYNRIKN